MRHSDRSTAHTYIPTGKRVQNLESSDNKTVISTLETTQGQMAPPKSGHPSECYLNQVAFPESRPNICPQLDSRLENGRHQSLAVLLSGRLRLRQHTLEPRFIRPVGAKRNPL